MQLYSNICPIHWVWWLILSQHGSQISTCLTTATALKCDHVFGPFLFQIFLEEVVQSLVKIQMCGVKHHRVQTRMIVSWREFRWSLNCVLSDVCFSQGRKVVINGQKNYELIKRPGHMQLGYKWVYGLGVKGLYTNKTKQC